METGQRPAQNNGVLERWSIGMTPSAVDHRETFGYWLSAIGYWLFAKRWLLAIGYSRSAGYCEAYPPAHSS